MVKSILKTQLISCYILGVYLLLGISPTLASDGKAILFSRQEIFTMNNWGIKMALEGERQPYVIPVDITHERLVQSETLSFSRVDLHQLPLWLERFTKLRHLDLSYTHIKANQLTPLYSMQVLENLNLTGTQLFGPNGDEGQTGLDDLWGKLTNLRVLKLGDTAGQNSRQWWFSKSSKSYGRIGRLVNLIELDLSNNQLADLEPLELAGLSMVRKLNLSGNRLNDLNPAVLPRNVDELDLSNSHLKTFLWQAEVDFPNLGLLKIGGNSGLTIAPEWGDIFLMQSLAALDVDSDVVVPKGWRDRIDRLRIQEQIHSTREIVVQPPVTTEVIVAPPFITKTENQVLADQSAANGPKSGGGSERLQEILIDGRYKYHEDGTVTDIQTGLMWKRCSEGQIWTGSTCTGDPDTITWSKTVLKETHNTWPSFAGYNDWYIPTQKELRTLVRCTNGTTEEEAYKFTCAGKKKRNGTDYQKPVINTDAFPNTPTSKMFWSAPTREFSSKYACYLNFNHGGRWCSKNVNYYRYIRLVRSSTLLDK